MCNFGFANSWELLKGRREEATEASSAEDIGPFSFVFSWHPSTAPVANGHGQTRLLTTLSLLPFLASSNSWAANFGFAWVNTHNSLEPTRWHTNVERTKVRIWNLSEQRWRKRRTIKEEKGLTEEEVEVDVCRRRKTPKKMQKRGKKRKRTWTFLSKSWRAGDDEEEEGKHKRRKELAQNPRAKSALGN
jgi:hypothetical protein